MTESDRPAIFGAPMSDSRQIAAYIFPREDAYAIQKVDDNDQEVFWMEHLTVEEAVRIADDCHAIHFTAPKRLPMGDAITLLLGVLDIRYP